MNIRFLGIEIERKTDILAFAAFLLSLSGIMYQIIMYMSGPQVSLARPRQVIVFMHQPVDTTDPKQRSLSIISTVMYVNNAPPGKNAVVKNETVSFSLNGEEYTYDWHQFISLAFVSPSKDNQSRKGLMFTESR